MAKIAIDVGHGKNTFPSNGKGIYKGGKGYAEYNFNQMVGKKLKKLLESAGHKIVLGQPFDSNDVPLTTRTNKYNAENVDVVVSIHADANNNPQASGRYYFYWHNHAPSKKLAKAVADAVKAKGYALRNGDGTIASVPGTWTNLHIVRETKAPAILGENGFMTNPQDFELIFGSKQDKYTTDIAEAYFIGIQKYLGLSADIKVATTSTSNNAFKVGDIVSLGSKATTWKVAYDKVIRNGGKKISNTITADQKKAKYKVTWLASDGSIEVGPLDGKGNVTAPRYRASADELVWSKDNGNVYTVAKGDTLWAISQKTGVSVSNLKSFNGLKSDTISIGQQLKLVKDAKPTTYRVNKGDTLWAISQKTGVSVSEIKKANGLTSNLISIGQVLSLKTNSGADKETPAVKPEEVVHEDVKPEGDKADKPTKPKEDQPKDDGEKTEAVTLADNEILLDGTVYVVTEKG